MADIDKAVASYSEFQKKSKWYLPAKELFEAIMEKSSTSYIFNCEAKEWKDLDIAEVDAFMYIIKCSFFIWREKDE